MISRSLWAVAAATLALSGCHEHKSAHADDHSRQGDGHASTKPDQKGPQGHDDAVQAHAQEAAQGHDHGHGDHDKTAVSLSLNNGRKWQTDEPLRAGMAAIRNEVQAAVDPIHAEKYSPEDYKALAGRIEAHVTKIMSTCKLPVEVDAQIHVVLAQFFAGTGLMKKDGDRMAGAVKVVKALAAYAEFFEHPNWQPIKH